ncbi:hypothetical protein MKX01_005994 [Papaver californicum]|nr:hypothetical protein MKX01_005994 [Papaver californicum]
MKKSGNKDLFFNDGWPEFVHAHSLQYTGFLVFKYKGNSKFHVKIYAKTGCEKELPSEFTEPILEVKQQEETDEETTYGNGYNEQRKSAGKTERKNKVVKSAMPRISEHPHFVAVWRDTRKSHLTIPKDFARKFGLDKEDSIVLGDPKGRSWPVDLIQVAADGRIDMADGWAQFSVGNKLSAGDICLFQVINQTKGDALNVLILPKAGMEKQGWEVLISRRPIQYLNPKFKTRNLIKRPKTASMTIPAKGRVIVKEANAINSEQKSAPMKIMRGDARVKSAFPIKTEHTHFISIWRNSRKYHMERWSIDIGKGWVKFSLGNRLCEGDACLFEFRNYTKGNKTLNVRIIKKSDFETLISSNKRIQYLGLPGSKMACATAPAKNRATQAANAFKSKNPTCEVIMTPSYVRKWGIGHMPAQFAKLFLTEQGQTVTLWVSDGRLWHVRCTTSSPPKYQAHLLKGWSEFVLGNHLKEGDVCVFELVDKDNLEINVTISRVNSTS